MGSGGRCFSLVKRFRDPFFYIYIFQVRALVSSRGIPHFHTLFSPIMLLRKAKGLFIEVGEFCVLVAKTSGLNAPLTVESLEILPAENRGKELAAVVEGMTGKRGAQFVPAKVGVYPGSRFLRRHSIESAAKAKEAGYLQGVMAQQLKLDPAHNIAAVLNATDGSEFSLSRPIAQQKELIFAGAKKSELAEQQLALTEASVYPETLELGTLSTLAGLFDYIAWKGIDEPVLVLEMGMTGANVYIISRNLLELSRSMSNGLESAIPQIQEQLGLKDAESARKLFFSNTFDFTEMGGSLLRRLLKELQAAIGFFEVQTGMTIGHLHMNLLPEKLSWIPPVMAKNLGVKNLEFDYAGWLPSINITVDETLLASLERDSTWFGLFSLMGQFNAKNNGSKQK